MNKFLYGLGVGMLVSGTIVISLGGGSEIAKWILPFGMIALGMPSILKFAKQE